MRRPLILATQAAHDAFIARGRGRDVSTSRERGRGVQSTLIVGRPFVEVRYCPGVADSACGDVECLVKICLAPANPEATYRRPASEDRRRPRDWPNRCPCGSISSPASLFWTQRGCELLKLSLAPVYSEATYRRPASWVRGPCRFWTTCGGIASVGLVILTSARVALVRLRQNNYK